MLNECSVWGGEIPYGLIMLIFAYVFVGMPLNLILMAILAKRPILNFSTDRQNIMLALVPTLYATPGMAVALLIAFYISYM